MKTSISGSPLVLFYWTLCLFWWQGPSALASLQSPNVNFKGVAPCPEAASSNHQEDPLLSVTFVADTRLPTDMGHFRLRAYRLDDTGSNEHTGSDHMGREPCVIYSADHSPFGQDGKLKEGVPVRVHDQCMTSEIFRSQRCDCKEQLKMAMEYIQENGGVIIYLQQEGRGIGLANKVAAYALQDTGVVDTVDANRELGLPDDARQYGMVPEILKDMKIGSIRLMSNNPRKVQRLTGVGVSIVGTIPVVVPQTSRYNRAYLQAKQNRMNHQHLSHLFHSATFASSKKQHAGVSRGGSMANVTNDESSSQS